MKMMNQFRVFDELIQLNPMSEIDDRETNSSSIVEQDPIDKTTKGLVSEERNKYALEICKRIREKLDGSDPNPLIQSSISEQVNPLFLLLLFI